MKRSFQNGWNPVCRICSIHSTCFTFSVTVEFYDFSGLIITQRFFLILPIAKSWIHLTQQFKYLSLLLMLLRFLTHKRLTTPKIRVICRGKRPLKPSYVAFSRLNVVINVIIEAIFTKAILHRAERNRATLQSYSFGSLLIVFFFENRSLSDV